MRKIPGGILIHLLEFRMTQEIALKKYKEEKNNEMVYVIYWSILEKVVKSITYAYRRQVLELSLAAWKDYLREGENRPVKAPKTDLEPRSLPHKPEFIAALNQYGITGDKVWKIMDSKGKFRRHRNEIAHVGKRFVNVILFHDLCFSLETLIADVYDEIQSYNRMQSDEAEPKH